MTRTRDFKSFAAAKRFKNLMRLHGVEARLFECRGLMRGLWAVSWVDDRETA